MEIFKSVDLYPYRVFMKTGNALLVYVPYRDGADFDKALNSGETVHAFGFDPGNPQAVNIWMRPNTVSHFDDSYGKIPKNCEEYEKAEKLIRSRTASKKSKKIKDKVKEAVVKKTAPKRKF